MATNRLSIGVNFSLLLSIAKTVYLIVVAYYCSFMVNKIKYNKPSLRIKENANN